jgi:membrane-associated phospholipid phosphatase
VSGRREIAIGIAAYAAYLAARRRVWNVGGRQQAERNSGRLVALERRMGVFVEPRIQTAARRAGRLVTLLNIGYAAANVTLSVGWLMWLYARCDATYRRERRAVLAAWAAAIPVFAAFPLAPPRKLEGFVDTLLERGIDIERPALVRWYNPIAAMPSYHVAFATVTGLGLSGRARRRLGRASWQAYPAAVALIVVATGNHYVADVLAGAVLGGSARALTKTRR